MLMCMLLACSALGQGAQPQQPSESETVTVSKTDLESLKARLDRMEQEIAGLKAQLAGQSAEDTESAGAEPAPATGGGRHLALPDISLIVQATGKLSNDKNDPARQKLELSEAELGVQGYVYPNVKADAFITGSPAEGESFQVEEAYLTYQGLSKGLNLNVGEKHVSFGRTNLLHRHSWPYTRQPLAITNFVAPESLAGQGFNFSYLLPTNSPLFVQFDAGIWSNGTEGEQADLPEIMAGPGANLTDRFQTARLWSGYSVSDSKEIELGASWAGGKSNEDPDTLAVDRVRIKGVDLSYRQFGEGSKRLLLRGEHFWRNGTTDSDNATAKGYYLFGNYRWDKYGSLGLLYDWSEFPQAPDLHESAASLIFTKQFSEQYYLRLQAIHGSRPDDDSFNELWLQWVWGVGPHTHELE